MTDKAWSKDPFWKVLVTLHIGFVNPVLFCLSFGPVKSFERVKNIHDVTVLEHCVHVFTSLVLDCNSRVMELAVHWEVIPAEYEYLLDFFVVFHCINDWWVVFDKACQESKDSKVDYYIET